MAIALLCKAVEIDDLLPNRVEALEHISDSQNSLVAAAMETLLACAEDDDDHHIADPEDYEETIDDESANEEE